MNEENEKPGPRFKRRPPRGQRPWTPEKVRERIQVSWMVRRLQLHFAGKLKVPLDATQIRAAEILLARALPTLAQTDLTVEGTLGHADVTDKPISADDWAKEAEDHMGAATRPPEAVN
jgi:hypothetical protein